VGIFDFLFSKKESVITKVMIHKWAARIAARKNSSPGLSAMSVGDLSKAVKEFSTTVKFGTQKEEGYLMRSLAYSLKGDGVRAEKDADSALLINGGNAEGFIMRAFARIQSNKMADALNDFKKAVALDLHRGSVIGEIGQEAIDLIES